MKGYERIAVQITNLLRIHPRGMTITGISQALRLNRNSVAKYLEILVTSGRVEKQRVGRAKLFFLSQRVPFSALLNLASEMILILDEDSRIWYVNGNLLSFEGRAREELIGKGLDELHSGIFSDPEVKARLGTPLREEFRKEVGLPMGGETRHFSISLVPTTLDDGSLGVTIIAGEITDRKRAEEALSRSERRYRSLFEHMMDAYIYCRVVFHQGRASDLIYLDVNPAFGNITGLRDVIGRRVSDVLPGIRESNPDLFEIYGRVATTGRPERFETYMPVLRARYSVSVYSPEKEHIVIVFEDITERRRTDESLKEHLFLFQELLDRVPVPVFYKDITGRYLGCNLAFELYTRKTRGEILGRKAAQVMPAGLAEMFEAMDSLALETGRIQTCESTFPHTDGTNRDFIIFKTPYLNRDGSPGGIVGTIIDTSSRNQAMESLRNRIRELEARVRAAGPAPGEGTDEGTAR
jgi:PAS domain S-box-containing protein